MYTLANKEEALRLRLAGNSYGDICKQLGVKSKGTLSTWFKGLVLTPEAEELLKDNMAKATERKLLAFNEERSERIKMENLESFESGRSDVQDISRRELQLIGAALYWGEGTKAENGHYNSLRFSNSDPYMIKIYMRFLREVLMVPEEKIYPAIHLYESINEEDAKAFWSACTGVPVEKFRTSYQVSRAGKGKRKTLMYGTLNIRVHNRFLFYRVKGMIAGIAKTAGPDLQHTDT